MEETKEQIDKYFKFSFLRGEAEYRRQDYRMERFEFGSKIKLAEVLSFILNNDSYKHIVSLSICRTNQFGGTDETRFIDDADEICNYDILAAVSYFNDKGELYPQSGENAILSVTYEGGLTAALFVRNMFTCPAMHYIRIYYMINFGNADDDMKTFQSKNLSQITFTTLAYHANGDDITDLMDFYEKSEKSALGILNKGEYPEDDYLKAVIEGLYATLPASFFETDGYYMLRQDRYYDAQAKFEKFFAIEDNPDIKTKNGSAYGKVNYDMYKCLMATHDEVRAFYYLIVANKLRADQENDVNFLMSSLCDFRAKHNLDNPQNNVPFDFLFKARHIYADAANALVAEMQNEREYLTMGFMLRQLLRVEKANILLMNVCRNVDGRYRYEEVKDKDEIWNYRLGYLLHKGNTIVLRYSRAGYECGIKEDKSHLCHDNSIIIQSTAIGDTGMLRVDVMVPEFVDDPFKKDGMPMGCADYKSFVISSEPYEYDFAGDAEDIYQDACKLYNEESTRTLEALHGFLTYYKMMLPKVDKLDGRGQFLVFDAAAKAGSCFMEFGLADVAFYYLGVGLWTSQLNNYMEYVNCLVALKDVTALSVIDDYLQKPLDSRTPLADEWIAFLKRRKAFVLIDCKRYEEAKTLLKSMIGDQYSEDFAIGELAYIEKQEKEQG